MGRAGDYEKRTGAPLASLRCNLADKESPGVKDWQSLWVVLRKAFVASSPPQPRAAKKMLTSPGTGVRVPFEILTSPGKGRGIFVTAGIKRGQLIWEGTNVARFYSRRHYERFLAAVPAELRC